ncbi:class I SAM-dependent methyltransferase [Sansalvadorimonas verongulae]|uniref:class I SAM-dependent methyltransferase n=1 Tax=Sansalvadorimonas verongulae TaxID=2172824 RepID=UPI0012BB5C68|nr:class I SAM-dependent methyltransferase [Sansalvadorimonas verongulae]MTI13868.1 class I SAM-dependent methyltransferase [Sansalvadorimonas verongulae]
MHRSGFVRKGIALGSAFAASMLLTVGHLWADGQYALSNQWEKARERLQLLEDYSNPYTFQQLEQASIQKGWTCLDAGAGLGGVTRWLSDKVGPDGQVDALDMETVFLEEIDKPNVHILKKNLVTDPLPEAKYDFIFARDVLMHIPEREEVVHSLAGALKPGGILMVEDIAILPYGVPYQRLTDDAVLNTTMQNLISTLEEYGHLSFHSGYKNIFYFEDAGLVDANAHSFSPFARGQSSEAKMRHLSLLQLTPVFLKHGYNAETVEQVRQHFLNENARFWGFVRVITTGRKPL